MLFVMKAELIKTDGSRSPLVPKNGTDFELDELYSAIGCDMIEIVRTSGGRIMVVDEEGLLKELPENPTASFLHGRLIVGDVVLCDEGMVT